MPIQRDNPYANFNFVVEIDGIEVGAFSEVDLPDATIEAIEYREGSDPGSGARKLPGRVSYANVVLKRGLTGRTDLWNWFKATRDGSPRAAERGDRAPRRGPQAGAAVAAPGRLAGALCLERLNGRGNEVVIETLELAYEGLELE